MDAAHLPPEDGYDLWLRYPHIADSPLFAEYQAMLRQVILPASSPTLRAARDELVRALNPLPGINLEFVETVTQDGTLIAATPASFAPLKDLHLEEELGMCSDEGFAIIRTPVQGKDCIVIAANTETGILYGVFRFLRQLQMHQPMRGLRISSTPRIKHRLLNHWDNLDGTIERGYAGFSLWDWHKLPDYLAPRYTDYARANASVGINGTVLNNANAKSLILTRPYLLKTAALAEVFRPYNLRVYLTAKFTAPMELDGLTTADPLDPTVIAWWNAKIDEIYALIPDFGGFVVKANSEGQPGPRDYGRSQADGANVLAQALLPNGGIVCWRGFIYDEKNPVDRARQAYDELVPLDGQFAENVILQVKNGPIDFQPREPYHPLFGAMPQTTLGLEVQITQEYLGHATHLVYLAPLFKEVLDAETGSNGTGSSVARVVDGTLEGHTRTLMAGIANIGNDRNWCGHPFAAANWFAFGRLAWNHRISSEVVAEDWLRMTFSSDEHFLEAAKKLMLSSRETAVDYMTPLGLHHIMARGHHYGPGPWVTGGRADWTSVYYHRADEHGIGFDRTATGSDALSQYCPPFRDSVANADACPDEFLLWFHHVAWQHTLKSGRTLWDELCLRYQRGVDAVQQMQATWESLVEFVDTARFEHVRGLLNLQANEAKWWRDACLLYFQTFSRLPIPPEVEAPAESLDFYMNLTHYYVPGIYERRFD